MRVDEAEDVVVGDGKVGDEVEKDVRVMVRWSRRSEAVWGCNCEMEVSGEISSSGEANLRKRLFCR